MNKGIEIKQKLKNTQGKILLEKTRLEYLQEIIKLLQVNPEAFFELTSKLEISSEDLLEILNGTKGANITLYEEALAILDKEKGIIR